jgi:hypothetical protein
MAQTITVKEQSMMIDFQVPLVFWGEAANTGVYLHQQTPNECLTNRDDPDGYQAPYPTPYGMLQAFTKPTHDNDGNEISCKANLHHLRRFGCFASRHIPEPQRHGKFSQRSKPSMMVGYVHNLTTLWGIWNSAFLVVRSQLDVIFDEERNANASCLHGYQTDILELPEEMEYEEEIETGGDGHLHDHGGTSRTGEGHGSGDYDCTDHDTDHNLPENRRSLPASPGVRSHPPDEDDAPQVSREAVVHNRHLSRENNKVRRTASMTKQSCQQPQMNRITRSQVKISAKELIIMAKALATMTSDPLTSVEAMDSPHHKHWKQAVAEDCKSILLNNTFTTVNSWKARQLRVKPIGSKWVHKTKHNSDGTIQKKARRVITGYKRTDFGESYAPVQTLTTFLSLISMVGKHRWIIDHLDIVTAYPNHEMNDDDIYMTLPDHWPEGLKAPTVVVPLNKALYRLNQAPRLWHNDINTFLPSLEFKQSLAEPNLYLLSDGILMHLYVDDISMVYPEEPTKTVIEVKARLLEKYKITNLAPARQFLGIEIHPDEHSTGTGTSTAFSPSQMTFITTILKRFNMQNAQGGSTPMDPNVKLDLEEDRGEKELQDIKGYRAIVGSLMYTSLATQPDISFAVAALSRYISCRFTSHLTAAKRVLQYLKATANFRLQFNSSSNSTNSNDQLTGYTDSDWANNSADSKSQGGHVFLLSNGAVSRQSRTQDLIAMSTLEAKYIACSEGSCEAKWLPQLP